MLDDHDLIDRAITQAYERLTQRDDEQQSELDGVQLKLAETRAAMDRYFRAFEAGTMPEDTCAPRIATLTEETKALERRASELARSKTTTSNQSAQTPPNSTRSAARYTPRSKTRLPRAPRPCSKP